MMTSFEVVFDFATQTYPGLNWLPQGVITKINEKKDSLAASSFAFAYYML
jgi:hypothetical protein